MEPEIQVNHLSPEDQKALNLGKYMIRMLNDIFDGKFEGANLVLPLKHNGGIVRCSLDTSPTKVETMIEFDDSDQPYTKWYHYTWSAQDQVWKLNK
jgi:hypothetical protein